MFTQMMPTAVSKAIDVCQDSLEEMKMEYKSLCVSTYDPIPSHWSSSLWEDFIEPEILDQEEENLYGIQNLNEELE